MRKGGEKEERKGMKKIMTRKSNRKKGEEKKNKYVHLDHPSLNQLLAFSEELFQKVPIPNFR